MLTWLMPGLLLQALIHVAAPGHTLFSIPALCIIGGCFLSTVPGQSRDVFMSAALVINLLLFLNYVPLPAADANAPRSLWRSVRDAAAFGTFETSLDSVRYVDDIARLTLREIKELTPVDRPAVIVTTDVHRVEWFLNWRIARYYVPEQDIWVVTDQGAMRAEHIRRDRVLESAAGDDIQIPIPQSGRVLWVLEPGAPFQKELMTSHPIPSGQRVAYMDVPMDAAPFRVAGYQFVPVAQGGRP
jgi:hypothetical protein